MDQNQTKSFPENDQEAVVNREGARVATEIWEDCPGGPHLEWEKQDLEVVAMVRNPDPNREKLVLLGKQQVELIFRYPELVLGNTVLKLGNEFHQLIKFFNRE